MGPLFERLREERSVDEEIEHRVAERMAHLARAKEPPDLSWLDSS